jgi:hypothetical protein
MSFVFQNIDPPPHPPLGPASVSSSPNKGAVHSTPRRAEMGVGGSIFWKTRDIGLTSYSIYLSTATSLAYPVPVGRRGVISSFKLFLPVFATLRGRGGGGLSPLWFSLRLLSLCSWGSWSDNHSGVATGLGAAGGCCVACLGGRGAGVGMTCDIHANLFIL